MEKDNPRFHVGTSLAPSPMIVVFGLGIRLRVCMRTSLETGILRNGSSQVELWTTFINLGEFVATYEDTEWLRCDKHQFRDQMMVST